MTDHAREALRRLVVDFVDGGLEYRRFHDEFMDAFVGMPETAISRVDQPLWDEIYELVYMGAADPVREEDKAVGIVGVDELRRRLGVLARDRRF